MIRAFTPEGLIEGRVIAFTQKDFRAIFHSYHPDAPFLNFFPDCNTYLEYAEVEIANTYQISAFNIIRTLSQGDTAHVLFCQSMIYNGESFKSLEIARCRRGITGEWLFEAGLRLDALKLKDDPLQCSWDQLFAAGNDLWI